MSQVKERHFDLIDEGRRELKRAYVDMLARLNSDIAAELKKSRGLSKGHTLLVIQGGRAATGTAFADLDLMKGLAVGGIKEEGKYSKDPRYIFDPTISRWKRATQEQEEAKRKKLEDAGETPVEHADEPEGLAPKKTKKEEKAELTTNLEFAKEHGGWFKDEKGNWIFGFEPTGEYTEPVGREEVLNLHRDLTFVASQLDRESLVGLMTDVMGATEGVVDTFVDCTLNAASWGKTIEQAFIEQYGKGATGGEDEIPDDVLETGREMYQNMMQLFWDQTKPQVRADGTTKPSQWKEASRIAYEERRKAAKKLKTNAVGQREFLKGQLNGLLEGDQEANAIRLYGALHDLGLIDIIDSHQKARRFTQSKEAQEKLMFRVIADPEAMNTFREQAGGLLPEQQYMVGVASFLQDLQQAMYDDPELERDGAKLASWWNDRRDEEDPIFAEMEQWFAQSGTKFDEEAWDDFQYKVIDAAEAVFKLIDEYQRKRPGGTPILEVRQGRVTPAELFQDPNYIQKMQEDMEDRRQRIEAALKAQDEGQKHKVGETIVAAIKKMMGKKADLFSFQRSAVAWMEAIKQGILAYDAGMGKTPISIAFVDNLMRDKKTKRGVIMVPGTLVNQWPEEIEAFKPGAKVVTISADDNREDRILKLKAINSGELEADFVVMTTSVLDVSDSIKEKVDEVYANKYYATDRKTLLAGGITSQVGYYFAQDEGIISGDELLKELKELEGAFIVDEVHQGGYKSKDTWTHNIAAHVLEDKEYKFGMTATPITQGIEDMHTLVNLFHPDAAGESVAALKNMLVKMEEQVDPNTHKVIKVPVAVHRDKLRRAKEDLRPFIYMQQKTMDHVSKEMESKDMGLTDLLPTAHPIKFEEEAQRIYAMMDTDEHYDPPGGLPEDYETDAKLSDRLESEGKSYALINMILGNRRMIRQQRCAFSPKLVNKNYTGPQPKVEAIKDVVARHFSNPENHDRPIVMFGSFHDSFDLMAEELKKMGINESAIGRITGKEKQKDRAATQDAVNAGQIKVVMIGIKAGGAGLNLQKASNRMIFLDKPWTPSDMQQAVGRVWRTKQKNDVHVHHFKVAGSTDENKLKKLSDRSDIIQSLSYADLADDVLAGKIAESQANLVGSFDKDVTEWTPEQKEQAMKLAGLVSKHDIVDLKSIPALRKEFKKDKFLSDRKAADVKAYGDRKIKSSTLR